MRFYNKYIFYKNSYLEIYKNRQMYNKWFLYNKYKNIYKLILFILIHIHLLKHYKKWKIRYFN